MGRSERARVPKKSLSIIQLADLGVQHLDAGLRIRHRLSVVKGLGSAFDQLAFPLRDLVGGNVELLGQFGQCTIPLVGRQRDLGLECR